MEKEKRYGDKIKNNCLTLDKSERRKKSVMSTAMTFNLIDYYNEKRGESKTKISKEKTFSRSKPSPLK